jgi:hypothetical protein
MYERNTSALQESPVLGPAFRQRLALRLVAEHPRERGRGQSGCIADGGAARQMSDSAEFKGRFRAERRSTQGRFLSAASGNDRAAAPDVLLDDQPEATWPLESSIVVKLQP